MSALSSSLLLLLSVYVCHDMVALIAVAIYTQIGKVLSHETLKAALEVLPDDLPLDASAPGGMIEYR